MIEKWPRLKRGSHTTQSGSELDGTTLMSHSMLHRLLNIARNIIQIGENYSNECLLQINCGPSGNSPMVPQITSVNRGTNKKSKSSVVNVTIVKIKHRRTHSCSLITQSCSEQLKGANSLLSVALNRGTQRLFSLNICSEKQILSGIFFCLRKAKQFLDERSIHVQFTPSYKLKEAH